MLLEGPGDVAVKLAPLVTVSPPDCVMSPPVLLTTSEPRVEQETLLGEHDVPTEVVPRATGPPEEDSVRSPAVVVTVPVLKPPTPSTI